MKTPFRILSMVFVFIWAMSGIGPASASDSSLELYGGANDPDGIPANQLTNQIFYDVTKEFSYSGGPVCLSAHQGECSPPAIDDEVRIYVDGAEVFHWESFTHDFGPVDFSDKLHIGSNQVRVQLTDRIGPTRGGSALWLVPTGGGGGNEEKGACEDTTAQTNTAFDQLQVGDILLTRHDRLYDLSLALIYGGYWTHTLVVSEIRDGVPYVTEAFANPPYPWNDDPGVITRSLKDSGVCSAPDTAILRVDADSDNRNQAGNYAKQQVGDPYNWIFWDKTREDKFYCSQLAWAAYKHNGDIDLDSNQSMVGIMGVLDSRIVTPDDLYYSSEKELVSIAVKESAESFKRAVIYAFSPVNLYLVNSNGDAIGLNPDNGVTANNMSNAFYSGPDTEPEFISIQDLEGDWTLVVSGTNRGEYTLALEDASEVHSIVTTTGTTDVGVQAKYDLNLNSGSTPLLTSQDQTPPTTTMLLDGTKGLNDWFVTSVKVTLSAMDNDGGVGVRNTEYKLDDSEWKIYDEPIMLFDGVHQLQYRSTDHVNNVETTQLTEIKVDTVPPVVHTWVDQPEYTRVQPFVAHFSGYDPEPGSGLASLTATFKDQPVSDGQTIDLFWLPLGQYTLTATGRDYAGWITTDSESITLTATIPSLQQSVSRLCSENYITKPGICASLQQKLNSALAAQQRNLPGTAVNILLAFQNELKAQKGKAVTVEAYNLLMMDSEYIITALGGKK